MANGAKPSDEPKKKPYLTLDAGVFDGSETRNQIRLDVEYNRVLFEFPEGFAPLPLLEECRALNSIDDFDLMYDITMQMLVEKPVRIYLRDYNGNKAMFAQFIVVNRYMDLRGVPQINAYPILVNWMVKFVSEHLQKKFPRPSLDEPQSPTSGKKKTQKRVSGSEFPQA